MSDSVFIRYAESLGARFTPRDGGWLVNDPLGGTPAKIADLASAASWYIDRRAQADLEPSHVPARRCGIG